MITLKDLKLSSGPCVVNASTPVYEINRAAFYPQTFLLLQNLPKALSILVAHRCKARELSDNAETSRNHASMGVEGRLRHFASALVVSSVSVDPVEGAIDLRTTSWAVENLVAAIGLDTSSQKYDDKPFFSSSESTYLEEALSLSLDPFEPKGAVLPRRDTTDSCGGIFFSRRPHALAALYIRAFHAENSVKVRQYK